MLYAVIGACACALGGDNVEQPAAGYQTRTRRRHGAVTEAWKDHVGASGEEGERARAQRALSCPVTQPCWPSMGRMRSSRVQCSMQIADPTDDGRRSRLPTSRRTLADDTAQHAGPRCPAQSRRPGASVEPPEKPRQRPPPPPPLLLLLLLLFPSSPSRRHGVPIPGTPTAAHCRPAPLEAPVCVQAVSQRPPAASIDPRRFPILCPPALAHAIGALEIDPVAAEQCHPRGLACTRHASGGRGHGHRRAQPVEQLPRDVVQERCILAVGECRERLRHRRLRRPDAPHRVRVGAKSGDACEHPGHLLTSAD
jgi:hypothetical protein